MLITFLLSVVMRVGLMADHDVLARFILGVANAIEMVTVNLTWFFVLLLAPLVLAFQRLKQPTLARSCKKLEQPEEKVRDKMDQENTRNIQVPTDKASESDDQVAQLPVDIIINSLLPVSAVGAAPRAVLAFDASHPDLEILAVSDLWASTLGTPNGNLSCLFKRVKMMILFQQLLRRMTDDAASGNWSPETATKMFRKVKSKFPDGSKQTMVISLVVPDPATRCKENENTYVVFLQAEWSAEACQRSGIPRRTTRGSQTASPKTSTCGSFLASIAEDEEQEPFESTVY